MKQAIRELAGLNDADFFAAIAEGLGYIRESLSDLLAGLEAIPEENGPARAVLHALANEEAGKALLLLDAVRCPRNPPRRAPAQVQQPHSEGSIR